MADPSECNINVVCRFRPHSSSEAKSGFLVVKYPSNDTVIHCGRAFTFDRVFKPTSSQELVYTESAKPIVADVLAGYNGTIFAYGQTASGKTHTMEGVIGDPVWQGVIPRIIQDIFNYIYTMDENLEFHIKVSYYEIYLDRIRDLLDVTKTNLAVHEDRNRVPYVKGASERFVSSPEEVMQVIAEGKNNRHIAVTNMNEHSSRSHSIFLINVKQENTETQKKLSGKLYLVDLAGSEKVSKTGAEGTVLDEAKNINKSLSALGNVISALAEGHKCYVPYRDSKMTRILQESLGGNARTTIVICCSPSSFNEVETRSTLMFGQRAKTIKNTVIVNMELTAEEWKRRYEKEKERTARLKVVIQNLEDEIKRWRGGETVPKNEQIPEMKHAKKTTEIFNVTEIAEQLTTPPRGVVNTTSSGSVSGPAVSSEERQKFEDERAKLYKQLDERDDEIQQQASVTNQLKQTISDLEDQLVFSKANSDSLECQVGQVSKEHESSKSEVKEVLQALEELAVNYDQKLQEVDLKTKDNEKLLEELNVKQIEFSKVSKDLDQVQDSLHIMKKKITEITNTLLSELSEIGTVVGGPVSGMKRPVIESQAQLDEEFTIARLYVTKLKTEIRTIVTASKQLEIMKHENHGKIDHLEKEVSDLNLLNSQHEVKVSSLNISLKEVEGKKRILEEAVDSLNEEIAQLSAKEQMHIAAVKDKEQEHAELWNSANEMKSALEEQMESHREAHQRQLAHLRSEIQTNEESIQGLKEVNQSQDLVEERLRNENDKFQSEINIFKTKIQELESALSKRETAQKDLQGLEETVMRELATLHKLRQMFVKDLQSRMKVAPDGDEDEVSSSQSQKQKITFLENNLEQLTKVHKQLVRDNADLRMELPKLEKRLKATQERVKALETALKSAKEGAMKDRNRYGKEMERLKQSYQKNQVRRGHQPQIAKPIRPGQRDGIIKINNGSGQNSIGSSDLQGSVVIRTHSPSKIPIIPSSNDRPTPVIRGGQRDGDAIIGGSGVSQRIKSAIGSDALPRSSRGHRTSSDDPRRSSMYVESSSNITSNGSLRNASSMERLNLLTGSSSPANERGSRRLPHAGRSPTPPQINLSGREAEIQALMMSNRSRSNSSQSSQSSLDGSPWERRLPSKSNQR